MPAEFSPEIIPDTPSFPHISFLSCRKCSGVYTFALPDAQIVTIFCGKPQDASFKALSYVCGMELLPGIRSKCEKCLEEQTVAISSIGRFTEMLQFVGGGNSVFIDILSIDQDNPHGLTSEILAMGNTYKHASTISVFLPAEDENAYWMLKELATVSHAILLQQPGYEFPYPAQDMKSAAPEEPHLLATKYISLVEEWNNNIKRWKYWKRAWTFQEWAVAAEIEATFEGAPPAERIYGLKSDISSACTVVCHYYMQVAKMKDTTSGPRPTIGESYIPLTKNPGNLPELHRTLLQKEEAFLSSTDLNAPMPRVHHQMLERERTGQISNTIHSLFPFQEFLVGPSEDDLDVQRQQTYLVSPFDSGIHISIPSLHKGDPEMVTLRASLSLALNALSTSDRESSFDADKIVCWTSMCGIGYDYDKYDVFAVALHKAISEMRKRGLRIFNYLANTTGAETDLRFLDYAANQKQCNAISKGVLTGGPVFVGRVDTCFHLKCALDQTDELVVLEKHVPFELQKIKNSKIAKTVFPTDTNETLELFRAIVTGRLDKQITDVLLNIEETLQSMPQVLLGSKVLISVSIEVESGGTRFEIDTWAIVPISLDLSVCFVARESLNGTLVIGTMIGQEARIVAYLTMTHQKYGTYLLKSEENGRLDVVFKREVKPPGFGDLDLLGIDELMSDLLGDDTWASGLGGMLDPVLDATISLEDKLLLVV